MYKDYPNIYYTMGKGDYESFALPAIIFTLLIFVCMLVYIVQKNWKMEKDAIILFAVWSIMTCTIFLPAMHDRYGFVAELLVWLFFLAKPSLPRFGLCIAQNFAPMLAYSYYFYEREFVKPMTVATINILVYLAICAATIVYLRKTNTAKVPQPA